MMMRSASIFIKTLCLLEMGYAMIWSGPKVTPAGLMAINGVSPRPTQAPGWNAVPGDLRKRAAGQYQYPPPPNWCGFIGGYYNNALTCGLGYTCTNSGAAFGCCTGPAAQCENIYTSCVDSILPGLCDADCTLDSQVLKCTESSLPWCGTYSFYGGTYLYNCNPTFGVLTSVESLADFYSALGSTLTSESDDSSSSESTRRSTSTRPPFPETTSTRPSIIIATSVSTHRVLSGAAIGGIAVGGAIVLVAIAAGIIAACCYRRRRQRRQEDQQGAAAQALMPRPPATFDPAQGPQQSMTQPERPYSAFKPSYLNPPSPYTDHAGSGVPSPIQPYDPSRELSHRASTVSTAVSPHPLHFEDTPNVPGPGTAGYFAPPPPPGGLSELSEGDGVTAKDDPGGGIPMQLRAGSPRSQIYSSVHEVPATTPETERWELPSRP